MIKIVMRVFSKQRSEQTVANFAAIAVPNTTQSIVNAS